MNLGTLYPGMGVFLFAGLLGGIIVGLLISGVLGGLAAFLISRLATRRRRVFPTFTAASLLIFIGLVYLIHSHPLPAARPGSDYDVAMSNLFSLGLWYSASIGAATALGALATLMLPGTRVARPDGISNTSTSKPPPLPLNNP